MLKLSQRSMTKEERKELQRRRPLFIFRESRKRAQAEIDAGTVDVLELEISKAWILNRDDPVECLFQVSDKEFVWLQSFELLTFSKTIFPSSRMTIVRSPVSHSLISVTPTSKSVLQTEYYEAAQDYLSECEIVNERNCLERLRPLLFPNAH